MQASAYFVLVSLLAGCHTQEPSPDQRPQAVRAVAPRAGPVVEGRTYLGELTPPSSVRVVAQVPGTAVRLDVPEGEQAEAGSALVRVAAPDVAARLERVRAERQRVEEERDFVCTQLDTDRVLADAGDLPAIQLAGSERACATAGKAVEAALAAEREAAVVGARAVEHAPFDGVVLAHLVEPGQTVMPGTPLVLFGSDGAVLRVRVPAMVADGLALGTRADTGLGSGKVSEIAAQALGPARLVEVVVTLDRPVEGTRMGTSWPVTLVVDERHDATAVPEEALGIDEGGSFVYVVEGDRIRRQVVEAGPRQGGWVAIEPGLSPDSLVVSGSVGALDPRRPVLAVTP